MTNSVIVCFIRRGTHLSNPNKGKWYKFNDTVIEEFEMNDASLEAECFGGAYKAKVYDHCKYLQNLIPFTSTNDLLYEVMHAPKCPLALVPGLP